MKKHAVLFLLGVLLAGYMAKAQTRWVEDPQMKFKISVPSNYQTNQFWEGTDKIHAFVSPDQNLAVRVRSIPVPVNATVDLIVQTFSQNIIKGARQLVIQDYMLNGLNGKLAAFKWRYNNIDVVIGAFVTIRNGLAYVIWSMVPENLLAKRSAESDAITGSFTVLTDYAQTSSSGQTEGVGSLGGPGSSQTSSVPPESIRITDMAVGSDVTSDFRIANPNMAIQPSVRKVYLAFGYSGNAKERTFITRWYNESSNVYLGDSPFFPGDVDSGRGNVFMNCPGKGWSEGRYRAEIWLDDQKKDETWFDVVAETYPNSTMGSPVPDGYFEMVSDDACMEHWAPSGYRITDSKTGQSVWSDGSGLNMVQQVIIKQTDFGTFMNQHINDIRNKGAEIIGSSSMEVNGLPVYQYLYKYGNSVFVYLSAENNNVFYLLGFAGNVSHEERAIMFSNTIINSFKKSNCPF